MNNEAIGLTLSEVGAWTLVALQSDEVMQWVNLALAALTTIVNIAYVVFKWYRKAKSDGKITSDEIEEGLKDVKDVLEKEEKDDGED